MHQQAPALGAGGRLPFVTRVLYGAGSMANGASLTVGGLLLLYYNQVVGLSAQLASLALAICVLVDAFWDPLVGQVSDNLRSRWGRRHPLMYLSAAPVGASYVLLFSPPHGLSQGQLFGYLLATAPAVRLSMSLYDVPSGALAPELAPDYHDRTALLGYRWLLGTVGGAIAAVLAYGVFLHRTAAYPLGQLNPAGYPPLALSVAALMAASIVVSSLGTHGRIAQLHRPAARRVGLASSLREMIATLGNRNFVVAVVAGVIAAVSGSLSGGLAVYFGTYFWRLPASNILVLVLTGLVSTPIAVALGPFLSRLWGKRNACMTLFFVGVVTANAPIVLRLIGFFPANGSPWLLPLLTLNSVLTGVLGTGGFILVTSMIADIVEEQQVRTGRRSEGLLFAADGLLNKIVSGFGAILPGLLLAFVGFPARAHLASLDPAIMTRLAVIVVPITTGLSSLSIYCWRFYRIDAASHARDLDAIARAADAMAEAAPQDAVAGAPRIGRWTAGG
ncbi:MAG TPA: MFS transporter [Caulobacteraceae bacterium]|nr:MFS transporter [Caulobacteraceae bacterium]